MGKTFRSISRRAARYKVKDSDNKILRFMPVNSQKILSTTLHDISETGVSFITSRKLSPRLGDLIKLEFSPIGLQIACMGRVVRIEDTSSTTWKPSEDNVKVGIQYYDLDLKFRKFLAEKIRDAFNHQPTAIRKKAYAEAKFSRVSTPSWLGENWKSLFVSIVLLGGVAWFIYYINTSGANSKTEAPWAQGFFDRNIPVKNK